MIIISNDLDVALVVQQVYIPLGGLLLWLLSNRIILRQFAAADGLLGLLPVAVHHLLLLLLVVLLLGPWIWNTVLLVLRGLLIRLLSVVIRLTHLLLLNVVNLWILSVNHWVRGLPLIRYRILLLVILVLGASVVECINPCVCPRLHSPSHLSHSLWVLLPTFTFTSYFGCVNLVRPLHLVVKVVSIMVDKASTLCRVLVLFFFNVWTCAIVRLSYVHLFIFFHFIYFLRWVILYFVAV